MKRHKENYPCFFVHDCLILAAQYFYIKRVRGWHLKRQQLSGILKTMALSLILVSYPKKRLFMIYLLIRNTTLICLLAMAVRAPVLAQKAPASYDVIVYGGTPAAVMAAISASQAGANVLLMSPDEHIGGMTSSGLGWTDIGNPAIIGGLARQFYHHVFLYYLNDSTWKNSDRRDYESRLYGIYRVKDSLMWTFEPHVAASVFNQMLRKNKVPVVTGVKLNKKQQLTLNHGKIGAIRSVQGDMYQAAVYIDATYEGDLMAIAGISFTVGREANTQYGETINGIESALSVKNNLPRGVDPYKVKGERHSGILPGVNSDTGGQDGQLDNKLQAYCYRICLTNDPLNRIRVPKPRGYKVTDFELAIRATELGEQRLWKLSELPNRKIDANNDCGVSMDAIGLNKGYVEAGYKQREKIARQHRYWTLGLIWTIQNNGRVPETVRHKFGAWGLPKDEFKDNGHFPYALYVREARRMISDYVMTEKDVLSGDAKNAIAMGAYTMDSHNTQRYITSKGDVQNEGDVQIPVNRPYPIAYGTIIPKRAQCQNLLVPVCLSASHIAYGSIRMEPVFMILGQSAGIAAALAARQKQAVQAIDYGDLRAAMLQQGQVLELGK